MTDRVRNAKGRFEPVLISQPPLCKCGCGQQAARYNNPDGSFNCWRKYAAGHAAWQQHDVDVPTNIGDLQYAAATIDCEGCIFASVRYLKNGRQQGNVRVIVTMCSPGVVTWLQATFGGRLNRGGSKKYRDRMYWQLTGTKVSPFLLAILPYLKEKRPQAEVALQFAATFGADIPRNRISQEIQELRERCAQKLKELKTSYLLPMSAQVQ